MKLLITGATGLIGSKLSDACIEQGHTVHYLTTTKAKVEHKPNYIGFYWNPETQEIDTACLDGVEVIVHLAGASIAKKWTKRYRKVILDSRIKTAGLLFDTLSKQSHSVERFISASGIGIYPPSLTKLYSEEDRVVADSFLGEVVVAWEAAADRFKLLGIDVTKVRTGLVLSNEGGALPSIVAPIKNNVGAALGSGKQWQSWIHIEDMMMVYLYILKHEWEGIFNAVAPGPVTNKNLTKQIALALDKLLWLPNVPGFVLKMILGEMATLIIDGQLVSSKKLEDHGFIFRYYNLKAALEDLL